jgi:phage terminase Nu1 subunit (DNA packaging protein)
MKPRTVITSAQRRARRANAAKATAARATRKAAAVEAEAPGGDEAAYLAARARKEAANAALAEIELARTRGRLLLAADVEHRLADTFLRCRTRLLGIPSQLRERAPHLAREDLALAEELIRQACEELADGGGSTRRARFSTKPGQLADKNVDKEAGL